MALGAIAPFAGCSRDELVLVDRLTCAVRVPAGRVLVREGRPADQLLVVVSGRARISQCGETLGIAESGACIGGRELRTRSANPFTVTTETEMVVRAVAVRDLRPLLEVVPGLEVASAGEIRFPERPVVEEHSLPSTIPAPPGGVRVGHGCGVTVSYGATRISGVISHSPGGTMIEEIEAFLRRHGSFETQRVLAAVMFTDIVGSTVHLTTLGDGAWHALLDAHDSIVGTEVVRHSGSVVNFLGDGALARFDSANDAVQCALAVREGVRELGIDMRAGLHVGEVELRGHDISGIAVHVASRICDIADSGCVLASRTLVELVAGSGLEFVPAGTHELKGLGGEWPLLAAAG